MHLADPSRTRLAVLGSPIGHSLSPTLHAAAYDVLGLPFEYGRHEVGDGALPAFVEQLGVGAPGWRGLSLTMPLKREVLPLLDRITPLVDELGVANTLRFVDEGDAVLLSGANTDVDGIVRPVRALGHRPGTATILGGGATAASALSACVRLGVTAVRVFLRDTARGTHLVELATRIGVRLELATLDALGSGGAHGFVVSTLPGGTADLLPVTPAGSDAVLLDVAYDPWPSALAEQWRADGGRVLSGLDMLAEQAVGQIRFFVSGDDETLLPDEDVVRRRMRTSVGLPPVIEG
ncbi:shikimate dehydrogenase family protein [Curtobacterium sp. RRHDQ10]|uniref:shikimate dehydrogenase family protein n=1 Tax=Curtobacterium phyllosphaerae TaxID=3413379 RepID=UPI003BF0212E